MTPEALAQCMRLRDDFRCRRPGPAGMAAASGFPKAADACGDGMPDGDPPLQQHAASGAVMQRQRQLTCCVSCSASASPNTTMPTHSTPTRPPGAGTPLQAAGAGWVGPV